MIKISHVFLALSLLIFFNGDRKIKASENNEEKLTDFPSLELMDFSSLRDTLYTFEPYFIEVNLDSQKGYLHSKEGWIKEFGVSSGNKKLYKAVETKEGLFVIQSKMVKWHSRQFDSTLMLNWMGFNWGIGFHALAGNSYYKYLGKKKSSHGCLRISKEDAKYLYELVNYGTPVLVHNSNTAVTISFADSNETYENMSFDNLKKILPERHKNLYDGKYFIEKMPKILIGHSNVSHAGLPIGDSAKIPKRQISKPLQLFVQSALPDKLKMMKIERNSIDSLFTAKIN